eukprot:2164401-Heterocapsa_arctica.AAC.1
MFFPTIIFRPGTVRGGPSGDRPGDRPGSQKHIKTICVYYFPTLLGPSGDRPGTVRGPSGDRPGT